jgi:hypothetical protein
MILVCDGCSKNGKAKASLPRKIPMCFCVRSDYQNKDIPTIGAYCMGVIS